MLKNATQVLKKFCKLVREHYIFLACLLSIIIGFDLVDSKYWAHMPTEGEIVGKNIVVGFKIVAGSILIGAGLLSLTILKKAEKNGLK